MSAAISGEADLDLLAVNTVRALSMDAVEAAASGHPGTPMALAPLGYALFTRHLAHDPADPSWPDRDRFVLSAGHASMLLYSLLHLTGYDLSLDDLGGFRQLGSRTPGHPENFVTPGVETTTGPLGQGVGNAVGMALAERLLAARFNRPGHEVVDHHTMVIASDGDLMEGTASESCSLAGHLGLDKLIVFWDDNGITIDGPTDLAFAGEDVGTRFAAYGWRVLEVRDVNDLDELDGVIKEARSREGQPTLVRVPTIIGWPAPNAQGKAKAHGSPLGVDEVAAAKQVMGWDHPALTVPAGVHEHADQRPRGGQLRAAWQQRLAAYREAHPDLAAEFSRVLAGELPAGWDRDLPSFATGDSLATRKASGAVINAIAGHLPELVGGSADLAGSNNTTITDAGAVGRGAYAGRNIHYGVREHGMAAIANGLMLHGGIRPFVGTFLIFADYLRPSLRLAALMGLPIIYVFSHDSIGLGEDGPTHQPIEHLASLRAIPGVDVIRPADATETVGAWHAALTRVDGPTALALTRQGVPTLATTSDAAVARGAYAVTGGDAEPDVVLLATGSEVALAVAAAELLADRGVRARVVSMPSWSRFAAQDPAYRQFVLPPEAPVLSVEAGVGFGWERYSDRHVGVERFGASAPYAQVYEHLGLTSEAIADAAEELIGDIEEITADLDAD